MNYIRSALYILALSSVLLPQVDAAIVVSGFDVTTYATLSTPNGVAFDAGGNLYVGSSATNARIRKIAPGGSSIQDIGAIITDPDPVIVDRNNLFGLGAGTVITGGFPGHIDGIQSDGTTTTIFDASTIGFLNPSKMAFDSMGRFYFSDHGGIGAPREDVYVSTGSGNVTKLFTVGFGTHLDNMAIDATDRIFTGSRNGVIRIYDTNGNLLDGSFLTGLSLTNLEFGGGGVFGTDLYAVKRIDGADNDEFLRINPTTGASTVVGTGFDDVGFFTFGPDQAIYAAELNNNRILRIAPASAAVPEPSSFALLGMGGLTLLGYGWRRRRKAQLFT